MRKEIKLAVFRRKWRKQNRRNQTYPMNCFIPEQVYVGKRTYGPLNVLTFNKEAKLLIGDYCSIGPSTTFLLSADHKVSNFSTYPFKVKILAESYEGFSKGDIVVKDDVWIGYGAIILSGVTIGQGAVIGAGAVVAKDIPPYAIAVGNPARVLRYRFNEEIIKKMMEIDFGKLDNDFISKNIELLYGNMDSNSINAILDEYYKRYS